MTPGLCLATRMTTTISTKRKLSKINAKIKYVTTPSEMQESHAPTRLATPNCAIRPAVDVSRYIITADRSGNHAHLSSPIAKQLPLSVDYVTSAHEDSGVIEPPPCNQSLSTAFNMSYSLKSESIVSSSNSCCSDG